MTARTSRKPVRRAVRMMSRPDISDRRRIGSRLAKCSPAVVFILVAIFGPFFAPWSGTQVVGPPDVAPNSKYLFGTDSAGLDVFSRVVDATRNDLTIGAVTTVLATAAGIAIGLAVGMNESRRGSLGQVARTMSRGLDLFQAIPAIVIASAIVAFFGRSMVILTFGISVLVSPGQARLVRTEVLKVRGEAFIDAARLAGESNFGLTVRHVLPNSAWPALVNSSALFATAILLTATLGFLGIGVQPPTPEWGSMLSTAVSDAEVGRWWPGLFPAAAITACVVSLSAARRQLFERK